MKKTRPIRYANYKEELQLRMTTYPTQYDLITLFLNAYELYKPQFNEALKALGLDYLDETGKLKNISNMALTELEDVAREMNSCGYEFLEAGANPEDPKFFKFIPIRYQPFLDELFEFAFHRELDNVQYFIDDFIQETRMELDELNQIDLGDKKLTLGEAEKIAQSIYLPAFELIKHEYILYVATKIREYNPHRTFHRLNDLPHEEKLKILNYIRYIVQSDQVITSGEMNFIDRIIEKLGTDSLDAERYKKSLYHEIKREELKDLSDSILEPIRRQILGLVIDSAYADRMLHIEEGPRVLEVARMLLTSDRIMQ
ncbi:MAG: hypothetical protein HQM12_07470 [SAR324 cluster bacterium]|nr:hypothetical protein [SAR324 cluster bacterium]